MNEKLLILNLIKQGLTNKEIALKLHKNIDFVRRIREQSNLPCALVIRKLLEHKEFKNFFTDLYLNNQKIPDIILKLQKHPLFIRKKINTQRVCELRNFYNLPHKLFQNIYLSDLDRIRGYIIRNIKYSSKRNKNNINDDFNLHYSDIELPEVCPLLNIKLDYTSKGNSNKFNRATVDRIDNSKGYIKGNIWIISRLANSMKNAADFLQLQNFSKNINKIIEHYKIQGALGSITDVFPDITLKT